MRCDAICTFALYTIYPIVSRCSPQFPDFLTMFSSCMEQHEAADFRMHDTFAVLRRLVVASMQLVLRNCSSSLYIVWLMFPSVPRIELEEQTRMREVAELKKSLEICNWNAFCFRLPF